MPNPTTKHSPTMPLLHGITKLLCTVAHLIGCFLLCLLDSARIIEKVIPERRKPACLRPVSEGIAPDKFEDGSEVILLDSILTQNLPIATIPSIDFTYPTFRRCAVRTDRNLRAMPYGALSMRHEYRLTAFETEAKTSYANTRLAAKHSVGGLSRAHGWSRDLDSSQAVAREGLG